MSSIPATHAMTPSISQSMLSLLWLSYNIILITISLNRQPLLRLSSKTSFSFTAVRRRLRKPSKVSTSVTSSVSRSSDQAVAASVNRPKIRGRPNIASRKSSAVLDNSVGTDHHKDKDGYKVSILIGLFLENIRRVTLSNHFFLNWLRILQNN